MSFRYSYFTSSFFLYFSAFYHTRGVLWVVLFLCSGRGGLQWQNATFCSILPLHSAMLLAKSKSLKNAIVSPFEPPTPKQPGLESGVNIGPLHDQSGPGPGSLRPPATRISVPRVVGSKAMGWFISKALGAIRAGFSKKGRIFQCL